MKINDKYYDMTDTIKFLNIIDESFHITETESIPDFIVFDDSRGHINYWAIDNARDRYDIDIITEESFGYILALDGKTEHTFTSSRTIHAMQIQSGIWTCNKSSVNVLYIKIAYCLSYDEAIRKLQADNGNGMKVKRAIWADGDHIVYNPVYQYEEMISSNLPEPFHYKATYDDKIAKDWYILE